MNLEPLPNYWAEALSSATTAAAWAADVTALEAGSADGDLASTRCPAPEAPGFLRHAGATLVSDFGCYPAKADRVDFPVLLRAMTAFPGGFRTWWVRGTRGVWLPAGYAAWHPLDPGAAERLVHRPETVRTRAVAAPPKDGAPSDWIYLFNYSVAPGLRGTRLSRALVRGLAYEIGSEVGLVAITVSDDGARVAGRFGMYHASTMDVGGTADQIWVRLPA